MNTMAPVRKCNICSHTKPWTPEHFDVKPDGSLYRCCRACLDKHHRNDGARAKRRQGYRRRQRRQLRTTPNRLCYGLQPNHMEWPEWI